MNPNSSPSRGSALPRAIDLFLTALIALNVAAFVASTIPEVHTPYQGAFDGFETFSVIIFSVEYLARLILCTAEERFRRPVLGRLRYLVTPLAIIDLVSILPFYLPLLGLDLRVLRLFRLMRLLRIFKLGRYSESLQLIRAVLKKKKEELGATLFIVFILLTVASSLIYFAESDAQPKAFGSIPLCMWWGVTTLTTIGYGDLYPITSAGRFIGSVVAILGIGLFAMPTAILGAAFVEEMQLRKRSENPKEAAACPHCGKPIP
ncbi:MAG: ion transporter [Planctomycetes bacterium]|nr:ion transporter [Planctomycetota bacterium]